MVTSEKAPFIPFAHEEASPVLAAHVSEPHLVSDKPMAGHTGTQSGDKSRGTVESVSHQPQSIINGGVELVLLLR